MISAMRSKLGPKFILIVIGVISFVFVFYGIFMPGGGNGNNGPGVAGEVNGESISYAEFNRAYNQRLEFFKGIMGGKVSEEQLKQFKVGEAVFQDLAQKKLLSQIARKEGFYPSLDQIREQILKMDAFKKDGRFDKVQYKNVLAANQYTPTRFEELIGTDIMEQNFRNFLGQLAYVSETEVEQELKVAKAKHKYKYVYLESEAVKKMLPVAEQASKLNQKVEELKKEIQPLLGQSGESKIGALLKGTKIQVKTSDWLTTQANIIQGVGSVRSIQEDLFALKKGEAARAFPLMGGTLIAFKIDSESYDAAKVTEKERAEALQRLQAQKQSDVQNEFLKSFMKKAKITKNSALISG